MSAPSFLRSCLLLATFAVAGALGACASPDVVPDVPEEEVVEAEFVSLGDLADELGLERVADGPHGRVVYADADGDELKALAGSRAMTVHGVEFDASESLRDDHAALWLTGDDAEAVRRLWVEEEGPPVAVKSAPRPRGVLPPPPPKRAPARTPAKRPRGVVVLDAGHGGKDPGASSSEGRREKDIVLDVALRASRLLQREGVQVTLTRSNDTFVELEERAAIGNRAHAHLFVSLHADAAASVSARGFSAYVRRQPPASSTRAADALLAALRTTGARDRGIREADFRVLRLSSGPAVLVELGFMSNPAEASQLADPRYRQRLAECVARGVLQYLGG